MNYFFTETGSRQTSASRQPRTIDLSEESGPYQTSSHGNVGKLNKYIESYVFNMVKLCS